MSSATVEPATPSQPAVNGHPLASIIISDRATIPAWVRDLETFRVWAKSGAMPTQGWYSYLDGELWADPSMEQIFSHGQVKLQLTLVLGLLVQSLRLGYFFPDRNLWTHPTAGISTEPDAMFAFWDTVRSGKLRLVPGKQTGFVEVEGIPDMVLEIISEHSVRKDTVVLRQLYWRAGVPEYWLVDARGETPSLMILRHTPEAYAEAETADGWVASTVFGKRFQLEQTVDPLGNPQYALSYQD